MDQDEDRMDPMIKDMNQKRTESGTGCQSTDRTNRWCFEGLVQEKRIQEFP